MGLPGLRRKVSSAFESNENGGKINITLCLAAEELSSGAETDLFNRTREPMNSCWRWRA